MNHEQLQYFLEVQARVTGICIRIYRDRSLNELLVIYGNHTIEHDYSHIPLNMTSQQFQNDSSIELYDEGQFLIGRILSAADGTVLLIGPVRLGELTKSDIDAIMQKYSMPQTLRTSIERFLLSTPVMPPENFVMMLSMFHLVVNEQIIPVKDFWKSDHRSEEIREDYVDTVDIVQPRTSGDYEETLRYYIKNGMADEIENLHYEDYQGIVGTLGPSQLRSMKNSLIILNSMCLRAAISGGLDSETAYTLGELYVKRIESAQSILDLAKLSHIIKRDYCLRVKRISAPQIENLYVLKASEYIQEHLYKKITAQELAGQVGVTPEYLSLLFQKNLNISIPQYIAQQKILEAKKLLRFTDKSLAEIAALLCFSSQSYFQQQFRRIRGLTPAAYREKYRKGIRGTE